MNEIGSYGSIYALGHRETKEMLASPVWVEEKIDGSQLSVQNINGELHFRSKGKMLVADAPEKMFEAGVRALTEIHREHEFRPGYTYRGEYLQKPKHNCLAYGRVPAHHFIVFDIDAGDQDYMHPENRREECARLGLECVPVFHDGIVSSMADIARLLDTESCLGGPKVEGVVLKSPTLFGADKKRLMAKYVSEAFKEKHSKDWKESNPGRHDVVLRLISEFKTEARWSKALQHLREDGKIEGSPRDIGLLIKEIPADIRRECEDEIKDALMAWAWPHIQRGVIDGMPQWYKDRLASEAMPVSA